MQRARNIELIFPIKDASSAALMLVKADCLHKAGIINEAEKRCVHSRARTFLDSATLLSHQSEPNAAASPRHVAGDHALGTRAVHNATI
jgi:hypothetical protein